MKSPEVSVIIPAYNAAAFINRCVDSVLAQTYKDYEIIIVDDGSTDDTPAIVDGIAAKNEAVHVVHQENKGLAEARHSGIKASMGKYVLHLDSDDTLTSDAVEFLYGKCIENNLDIVYGAYNRIVNESNSYIVKHPFDGIIDGDNYLRYLLNLSCICASWGCITRRSLWYDSNFPDKNLTFPSEDVYINIKMSRYADRIGFYNYPVYNYYYNDSSLSITGKLCNQRMWGVYFDELDKELMERGKLDELKVDYNILKLNRIAFLVQNLNPSEEWVKKVSHCDSSAMPVKYKILKYLIRYPVLLNVCIRLNRFVKRSVFRSTKY
jgi:glycosyltransferase involved in cell wall biosynthesis